MADLVELSDLKEILGISDTVDDARLQASIDAATTMVQAYCDRQFIVDDDPVVRVFVASTPWIVHIDDVATTTGLVVKTDEDSDGVFETTWSTADYQLEPVNGRMSGQIWPYTRIRAVEAREWPLDYGRALVQVTARFGWNLAASGQSGHTHSYVPGSVTEAAKIQAISLYKSADAPLGIAGFGDIGIMRLRQAMHPVAMALLAPFRKDAVQVA
jgi:hypothetical protein